jgi:hypothetical protein
MPRKPTPLVHGTVTGYVNRGCRCLDCREAWRLYNADAPQRKIRPDMCLDCGLPARPNRKLCARCAVERLIARKEQRAERPMTTPAQLLGRRGGLKGGPARAAKMTAEERHASAVKAARARWKR